MRECPCGGVMHDRIWKTKTHVIDAVECRCGRQIRYSTTPRAEWEAAHPTWEERMAQQAEQRARLEEQGQQAGLAL